MKEEESRDQAQEPAPHHHAVTSSMHSEPRKDTVMSTEERSFVLKQIESLKAEEVEQQHRVFSNQKLNAAATSIASSSGPQRPCLISA